MQAFLHRDVRPNVRTSSRVIAAGLTACVYGVLALLALLPAPSPPKAQPREVFAFLPLYKIPADLPVPPPTPVHMIRPHAESIALPAFTIANAPPPAALLPASAAPASSMPGGAPAATGAGSAGENTGNGAGNVQSGCFDAAWGQAVTDRIARFFRWPRLARRATGLVMVDFTVRRSGRLDALKIGTSSGNSDLDWAAYDMVRRAQPLPAIPDRMHVTWIEVELPINFGVTNADLHPAPGTCG